jgi:stage II sporulation protein R
MKKIIIVLFFLIVLLVFINEKKMLLIPNESIRFRVIANSDSTLDQDLKLSVKNDVEKELYNIIGNSKNIGEARNRIRNNIDKVNDILNKYNVSYDISYGNNYFPEKEYKGVKYSEGEYESVVITIGNGLGHNWWCVLFPPLCLLDEKDNLDDIEYEFYARELINKIK